MLTTVIYKQGPLYKLAGHDDIIKRKPESEPRHVRNHDT